MGRAVGLAASLVGVVLLCVGALLLLSPSQPVERAAPSIEAQLQQPHREHPYDAKPGRPLLVFMAGVEGSGHHLGSVLLKQLFPGRPEEAELDHAVRDMARAFNDMFIGASGKAYIDNLRVCCGRGGGRADARTWQPLRTVLLGAAFSVVVLCIDPCDTTHCDTHTHTHTHQRIGAILGGQEPSCLQERRAATLGGDALLDGGVVEVHAGKLGVILLRKW